MGRRWPDITGEIPDEALKQAIDKQAANTEPLRVPLVIYIGDVKRIIGEALVTGPKVEAYITPAEDTDVLERMVRDRVITNVSVAFNAPPAIPVMRDGNIRWEKDY